MADHPRHRQPALRRQARVIVAAVPGRIAHDRLSPDLVPGDALGAQAGAGRNCYAPGHHLRVRQRPLQRLIPTKRAARHRQKPLDAEVPQQLALRRHHIAHRHQREARTVRLARRWGPLRPGQSSLGSSLPRSSRSQNTCACRTPCPGRSCRPTSPGRPSARCPCRRRPCRQPRSERQGRGSSRPREHRPKARGRPESRCRHLALARRTSRTQARSGLSRPPRSSASGCSADPKLT